jgi:hypothetical protein
MPEIIAPLAWTPEEIPGVHLGCQDLRRDLLAIGPVAGMVGLVHVEQIQVRRR